jgi:hypothetical protein
VPSGRADSLNVPSLLGLVGGGGLVPKDGGGEPAKVAKVAGPDAGQPGPKGH